MRARASCGSSVAEDLDGAVAGAEQAGEDAEQGGFAGAVFADEDVAAAGLEVDGDLAQGGEGAKEFGNLIEPCARGTGVGLGCVCGHAFSLQRRSGWRAERGASAEAAAGLAGWRWRGCAGLGRSILAGALGLEDGGVELAVAAIGAFGQGLGIVLEGVRRRLGALVDDLEEAAGGGLGGVAFKLVEDKGDVGAVLLDGAGLDEALDAQLAVVGLVAHAAEFGDGDVVALVGAVAGEGQPRDGAHDHGSRNPDPQGVSGDFHTHP